MKDITIAIMARNKSVFKLVNDDLNAIGYKPSVFEDCVDFIKVLTNNKFDILLLYAGNTAEDIINIRHFIAIDPDLSIIVLCDVNADESSVVYLKNGADRVIGAKSSTSFVIENIFTVKSIKSRSHSRKKQSQDAWKLQTVNWALVSPMNEVLKLNAKEFALLKELIMANGTAVEKNQLAKTVIGKNQVNSNERINLLLTRLRKKASLAFCQEIPIKTAHSVGYVFAADAVIE